MSFDNRPELNLYWHIDVLSPNTVHFVNENSEMILKKHCYDGDNDLTYIDAILLTGQWEIALYEEGDMNLTDEYSIYSIDFLENGALKVLNPNNVVVDYGAWLAYRNEGLFLGLNFGLDSTFNEFNYRWRITHITEGRIELTDFSSTGTVERTLVLERIQ